MTYRTEACSPAVLAGFPCLCILGSSLSVHACHPRSALPAYWVCRVFSGSGKFRFGSVFIKKKVTRLIFKTKTLKPVQTNRFWFSFFRTKIGSNQFDTVFFYFDRFFRFGSVFFSFGSVFFRFGFDSIFLISGL